MKRRKKVKRVVSIIIIAALLASMFTVYAGNGVTEIPTYDAETLIEAESGYAVKDNMDIRTGLTASGTKCVLMSYGSKLENPDDDYPCDFSFKINVPSDGMYQIYMRYSAPNTGSDSIFIKWDDGKYSNMGLKVTGNNIWGWQAGVGTRLSAGEHTLQFLHREVNSIVDAFVVTSNYKAFDTAAVEEEIKNNTLAGSEFAQNSTANTFDIEHGYISFEAENATIDVYNKSTNPTGTFLIVNDADASGGKYVMPLGTMDASGTYPPAPGYEAKGGMEFNMVSDAAATYSIWARVLISGSANDSAWASLDGSEYKSVPNFTPTISESEGKAVYEWRKLSSFSTLSKGEKHNFRMRPRESGAHIDRIVVTSMSASVPSGITGELTKNLLPSGVYPVPEILPTENQRPRLYLTEADIPKIKENMQKEQNLAAAAEFETRLERETDGMLATTVISNYTNYNSDIMRTIEAYAFKYVLDKDTEQGREYGIKAKNAVLNFVTSATFDVNGQDVTREMGHTIFLASQVYDWCYDLFSEEEKEFVIARCEDIASHMEVGYPPKGQGAVCGHAGEAQIMRDLLGFGIAVYDERPDIYNYVGGRFFSQFIKPRNYWYESSTHHQGDAYGSYRYYWEVMAQQIIYRMTGGDTNSGIKVFNDMQGDVPYFWIYSRRPDGQVLRTGDCYLEKYTGNGYWNSYVGPMFLASNFYGDPIVKGEYEIENPTGAFSGGTGGISSVFYLLFNDPDLQANTDKTSLPLTKYFASPNGMMIARTGWDVNDTDPSQSDDVVAMMKIGERWGANHNHLDAGNFQLYYKGILASESGYYETYGSLHDQNYNKASIAHNILTVYDPNEKFNAYNGKDRYGNTVSFPNGVNDGGQRRPGGEPATWEIWNGEKGLNYDTGKVLDHEFGPDADNPEYTYIKGDITQAYSSKVSNVTRAMAFMPLDDENYPAIMVIMDKVTSTNPSFKKKWLLHMQQEPEIDTETNTSVIKNTKGNYNGKMTVQTLLPKNASVTKIGGEGKRYWIGNQAGDFENDGYNFDTLGDIPENAEIEAGWGRIEVSPPSENATDRFLNVLAVSDADNTAKPLESVLIEGEGLVGVMSADKVLMFADTDTSAAEKNRVLASASFTVPATDKSLDIMVAGMKAGVWTVKNGTTVSRYSASEDGGVMYFGGGSGTYTLTYLGSDKYNAEIKRVTASKSASGINVSVELDGEYEGAVLIAAAYDSDGMICYLDKRSCTAEKSYTFTAEDAYAQLAFKMKKVKFFLWNGAGALKPLTRNFEIDAGEILSGE